MKAAVSRIVLPIAGATLVALCFIGFLAILEARQRAEAMRFLGFLSTAFRGEALMQNIPLQLPVAHPLALAAPEEWKTPRLAPNGFTNILGKDGLPHTTTRYGILEVLIEAELGVGVLQTNVVIVFRLPLRGVERKTAPYSLQDFRELYLKKTGTNFEASVGINTLPMP